MLPPLQLNLDALAEVLLCPGAAGMTCGPAALEGPAAKLINEPVGSGALQIANDPTALSAELVMDGDPPALAGLGVIVEDDRERTGRHGEAGEGRRSQARGGQGGQSPARPLAQPLPRRARWAGRRRLFYGLAWP